MDVPDDAHGVLQDVHWSGRDRLLPDVRARERDLAPDLARRPRGPARAGRPARCRRAPPLSDWLRDTLYSLGRKLMPKETIERLTGSPEIDPAPYLAYLRDKVAALAA